MSGQTMVNSLVSVTKPSHNYLTILVHVYIISTNLYIL